MTVKCTEYFCGFSVPVAIGSFADGSCPGITSNLKFLSISDKYIIIASHTKPSPMQTRFPVYVLLNC